MSYLMIVARELLAAAIVLLPVFLLLQAMYFRNGKRTALCAVFTLYLCGVYILVGLPTVMLIPYLRFDPNINWIPFSDWEEGKVMFCLNIALFVPLGVFLPLLWRRFWEFLPTVCTGFGLSLLIELVQLFCGRATDVDDLIANTAGTVIGFVMAQILLSIGNPLKKSSRATGEVFLFAGLTALTMFFAQPFVAEILMVLL